MFSVSMENNVSSIEERKPARGLGGRRWPVNGDQAARLKSRPSSSVGGMSSVTAYGSGTRVWAFVE